MTTQAPSQKKAPTKPGAQPNRLGLEMKVYKGHESITSAIIKSFFEYGVEPHMVSKLSGIGCWSKTTAYFLNRSHGFNAVHGRMAAIAVGTNLANRQLVNIGVSGDGDTASIGLSHYLHMVRRNTQVI